MNRLPFPIEDCDNGYDAEAKSLLAAHMLIAELRRALWIGQRMRERQNKYFRGRTAKQLQAALYAEKKFDQAAQLLIDGLNEAGETVCNPRSAESVLDYLIDLAEVPNFSDEE